MQNLKSKKRKLSEERVFDSFRLSITQKAGRRHDQNHHC